MGLPQDEFLTVIQYIPSIFALLNEAYKLYLYWVDFPSSSIDKFLDFLTLINLVKPDITYGKSVEGLELERQSTSKASREQHRMQRKAVLTII